MWVGGAIENATRDGNQRWIGILCHVYKVVSRLSFKLRSVTRVTLRWTGREHARFVGRRVLGNPFQRPPGGPKAFLAATCGSALACAVAARPRFHDLKASEVTVRKQEGGSDPSDSRSHFEDSTGVPSLLNG